MWTARAVRWLTNAVVPSHKLRYSLIGSETHVLRIDLNEGQSVFADPGALLTMSSGVEMLTEAKGGFSGSLLRAFSGAGVFVSSFRNTGQGIAELVLGPDFYSKILPYAISPQRELVCQRHTFLCGEEVRITQDLSIDATAVSTAAALFGGGGLVHQKISGNGLAFLKASGAVFDFDLKPGETWTVSPESWVAYEPSVTFQVSPVLNLKNSLFGQGLVLVKFTGPGKLILQSMPAQRFVDLVKAKGPKEVANSAESSSKGGSGVAGTLGTLGAASVGSNTAAKVAEGIGQSIPVDSAPADEKPAEDTEHDTEFMSGDSGGDSGGVDDGNEHAVGPSE